MSTSMSLTAIEADLHRSCEGQDTIYDVEKVVRVFNSFEDADRANARNDAELTPQERLKIVEELRERTHPDAPKQRLARVCRITELASS